LPRAGEEYGIFLEISAGAVFALAEGGTDFFADLA
jgi:hypothetical protein